MKDKVYNVNESFKNIEILVKTTNIEICKSDTSDIKIVTTKREGSNYSVLVDEDNLKIRDCRKKWYMYLLPCFCCAISTTFSKEYFDGDTYFSLTHCGQELFKLI